MVRSVRLLPAIALLVVVAGCGSDTFDESPQITVPVVTPTASVIADSSSTSDPGAAVDSSGEVPCPQEADEIIESDIDADGSADQVYLRAEASAHILGVCLATGAVSELDVGGMATSVAGVFDINGDGHQEIFVFDTSARSIIYNAAMLTPSGLEWTTLLLERTIDLESGAPFNATTFRCVETAAGSELRSIRYVADGESVRVTTSLIRLDGAAATETVTRSYNAEPGEALFHWQQPDHCFE